MGRNPFDALLSGVQLREIDAQEMCEGFFSEEFSLPEFPLTQDQLPQWICNAMAEAAIFNGIIRPESHSELPENWMAVRPFGDRTPELGHLLEIRDRAMTCFPTCTEKLCALWHLYIFRDRRAAACDHRRFLSSSTMFDSETAVFISSGFMPPKTKLRGCSWQLAAKVALDIEPRFRPELARQWLITGEVKGSKIISVKIGAKQEIFENTKRNILLPRGNEGDINVDSKIFPAETVDQALRQIDRQGFVQTPIELPERIRDLHILVGGSFQPVMSVILLTSPQRVFLWCSDGEGGTNRNASIIDSAIKKILPGIESHLEKMDSHNLQSAYDVINSLIKTEGGNAQNAIVCNTGGNRLMGTAALLAAHTHNLTVVYRDKDAAPDVLTALTLGEKNRYMSGDVRYNKCRIRNINWPWLYGGEKPTIGCADDLLNHVMTV